jgi:polar amino acid transport system permease protein
MLDILHDNWIYLLIGQYPAGPLGGVAMTLVLAVLGVLLSLPIGVLLAVGSVSPSRLARALSIAVITGFRGMPLLLLIFWAYFLIPALTGWSVSPFVTLLSAIVLYQSAYMAEVVRSGIKGVHRGQFEASTALGFGFPARMVHFILPQAFRAIVPSLITQFVSIVKDTSLGYVISVNELTFAANQINSTLLTRPFQVFGILAITYFVICFGLASLARLAERKLTQSRSVATASAGTPAPKTEASLT